MNSQEFSREFDVLINSFSETGVSITLDEYEKSVYLTKAQEDIVLELYNGKNPFNDSFEKTEEIRRSLDTLIRQYSTSSPVDGPKISKYSTVFAVPEDLWFITYEAVTLNDDSLKCNTEREIGVTPITQDEFDRVKGNPFRGPSKRRALRLDLNGHKVEIVSKYNVAAYTMRYMSRPTPIILIDLPEDLSINGVKKETECKLNPVIHRAILERAMQMALQLKAPTGNK